jgi:SAM-dependent methyltransferase
MGSAKSAAIRAQGGKERVPDPRVDRQLAYPLPIAEAVPLEGRVRECAGMVQTGVRLLDIGCSSGWMAPIAMSRGFKEYVGVDRVIVGAERAIPGASFVEGSIFSLPFSDKSFDTACLFDVIEHLPKGTESAALLEAYRVLGTQGKLYFSTPHASPLHAPLDPAWYLGHRHYSRTRLRRLLQSAGFSVDRMFVAGGVVECLDHIRLLLYKHVVHRRLPRLDVVNRLIERSHGRDRTLGMTVFAIASRPT